MYKGKEEFSICIQGRVEKNHLGKSGVEKEEKRGEKNIGEEWRRRFQGGLEEKISGKSLVYACIGKMEKKNLGKRGGEAFREEWRRIVQGRVEEKSLGKSGGEEFREEWRRRVQGRVEKNYIVGRGVEEKS